MSELTPQQRRACWAISRHYSGDGRWGDKRSGVKWYDGFMVRKYRPRKIRWEQSKGRNAKKVHALRYRITASTGPRTPVLRRVSVWWCGGQSVAPTEQVRNPDEVCRGCFLRVAGLPQTVPNIEFTVPTA